MAQHFRSPTAEAAAATEQFRRPTTPAKKSSQWPADTKPDVGEVEQAEPDVDEAAAWQLQDQMLQATVWKSQEVTLLAVAEQTPQSRQWSRGCAGWVLQNPQLKQKIAGWGPWTPQRRQAAERAPRTIQLA